MHCFTELVALFLSMSWEPTTPSKSTTLLLCPMLDVVDHASLRSYIIAHPEKKLNLFPSIPYRIHHPNIRLRIHHSSIANLLPLRPLLHNIPPQPLRLPNQGKNPPHHGHSNLLRQPPQHLRLQPHPLLAQACKRVKHTNHHHLCRHIHSPRNRPRLNASGSLPYPLKERDRDDDENETGVAR